MNKGPLQVIPVYQLADELGCGRERFMNVIVEQKIDEPDNPVPLVTIKRRRYGHLPTLIQWIKNNPANRLNFYLKD